MKTSIHCFGREGRYESVAPAEGTGNGDGGGGGVKLDSTVVAPVLERRLEQLGELRCAMLPSNRSPYRLHSLWNTRTAAIVPLPTQTLTGSLKATEATLQTARGTVVRLHLASISGSVFFNNTFSLRLRSSHGFVYAQGATDGLQPVPA
jgi:hypothetical protein